MSDIKNSLANYPKKFLGYVVSPLKICLQFEEVESKLRFKQGAEYIKLPTTEKAMVIKPTGSPLDILSVGCPIEVLLEAQTALVEAYREYMNKHGEEFKEKTGRNFKDELRKINKSLDELIT